MFGLSNGDSDQGYADIDYAFYTYPATGQLWSTRRASASRSLGAYAAGDTLRIAVVRRCRHVLVEGRARPHEQPGPRPPAPRGHLALLRPVPPSRARPWQAPSSSSPDPAREASHAPFPTKPTPGRSSPRRSSRSCSPRSRRWPRRTESVPARPTRTSRPWPASSTPGDVVEVDGNATYPGDADLPPARRRGQPDRHPRHPRERQASRDLRRHEHRPLPHRRRSARAPTTT